MNRLGSMNGAIEDQGLRTAMRKTSHAIAKFSFDLG